MTVIIDYGAGNVGSVEKAVRYVGGSALVSDRSEDIMKADSVILPGVGAFGSAVEALRSRGLEDCVRGYIGSGRPFLGICLGLQTLFNTSEEAPGTIGLGVFRGKILRIPSDNGLKVPHIGWNSIEINRDCPLFAGLDGTPYVYFVHSYYLHAEDPAIVAATAEYGVTIHAAVWKDNCFATQFHPEKSGDAGLHMLGNFMKIQ